MIIGLEDVPYILGCMAEFAACNAGTEVELANGDAIVLDVVREIVVALGHGTNEYSDALVLVEASNVVADTYDFRVEAKRYLAAVGREMVCDGVLDHLNELLLRRGGANLVSVQQLHHQASKSLECSGDADGGAHADEDVLRGLDIDLELSGLVDGRVEESE